jgi:glucan phosphoethanolaminetransferase (alkaline phosphatase superfamily)
MGELGFLVIIIFLSIIYSALYNFNLAQKYFKSYKNKTLIKGLKVGLLSFVFSALFLSAQVERIFWVLLAFSVISYRVAKKQELQGVSLEVNQTKNFPPL